MTDSVTRFLFDQLEIRGALVRLGSAWRAMQTGREYAPAARALLGQMTAVTALLGNQMKAPGKLSIQIQGHGAVRLLVVDCDEQLRLRGIARAPTELPAATVPELLGDGKLVMTLRHDSGVAPYQSLVPLEGATIAEIFENYLNLSVQQPARLWLCADESSACGLLLQKMPRADERDADGWNRIQQLAATVRTGDLSLPPETLLARLFPDEAVRLYAPRAARYHCPRDEDKVLEMLRSLGREEVVAIVAEHGAVVINDEICNHEYRFGPEIVERLFPVLPRTFH